MSGFAALAQKQLIVVTGKGGVGKSAVTAALGRSLAARGRRTLALEVDPRENLHQLLDVAPSGGEVVAVEPNLYLQNLKPRQVIDWIVERQVKIGFLVKKVLASPIYHRFAEGSPGFHEMATLGHAQRLVRGELSGVPPLEVVVLDAPATGHGIFLLTAPQLFAETVGSGPFADLARSAARFVADCAMVVVTLAEEMPVQEALELRAALALRCQREPELLVINSLYPPLPKTAKADRDPLTALWRERRQVNERELRRVARAWEGTRVELPLLPLDRGPELIDALFARLDQAWTEAAA